MRQCFHELRRGHAGVQLVVSGLEALRVALARGSQYPDCPVPDQTLPLQEPRDILSGASLLDGETDNATRPGGIHRFEHPLPAEDGRHSDGPDEHDAE